MRRTRGWGLTALAVALASLTALAEQSQGVSKPRSSPAKSFAKKELTSMGPINQSAKEVKRCALLELTFEATGTYETPFDPDQVAVDATFVSPSGKKIAVPGFYYQDYDRKVADLSETLTPKGAPVWKVRFAPAEEGRYAYTVVVKDHTGSKTAPEGSFACVPSDSHGCLRVSKSDPHYFEFDDKTPYLAIGHNVCWYRQGHGTPEYDRWFGRMAENGENYARIWMPEWAFGLETEKLGSYRLDRAWQLDYVMRLAEAKGIYIKLCAAAWRRFEEGKPNPYWKNNGGPCETELDFFTKDEPKRYFRNRLRYLVARWGYSTHIMAWELWNEFNTVRAYKTGQPQLIAWSAEMARYLKSIDPWKHMTTQSLGSCNFDDALWHLPEMDWAQMHGYYYFNEAMKRDAKDMAYFIPYWQDKIRAFGKPAMFAEFGISQHAKELWPKDPKGVNLHTGIWPAVMAGGCGTAMLWWWDSQIDPMDQYWNFKPLAEFARGVPWTTQGFAPDTPACSEGLKCYMLEGRDIRLLWVYNKAYTWWNVVQGAKIEPVKGGKITLDRMGQGEAPYVIEWWDTYKGGVVKSEEARIETGQVTLTVPDLPNDIAAKIRRKQ